MIPNDELEKRMGQYLNTNIHFVNSGTSALMVALVSLRQDSDTEIIGPSYGHPAWINVCRFMGYNNIKFVDINRETLSLDPACLREAITPETGIVFYINKNGYVGDDTREVKSICDENHTFMIEDACNAFGQKNGDFAGTIGDIGCYSFGQGKLLSCGEGGAIVVNDTRHMQHIKELAYQGGWYRHNKQEVKMGGNFAMSPLLRTHLLSEFQNLPYLQELRQSVVDIYDTNLHTYPTDKPTGYPMNILFSEDREEILRLAAMLRLDIRTGVYRSMGKYFGQTFPVSEAVEEEAIFLPVNMTQKHTRMIKGIICAT